MDTVCNTPDNPDERLKGSQANQISTLAEQLGASKSIMSHLAEGFANNNEQELAAMTRDLETALNDPMLLDSTDSAKHKRLLNYVYPIV